MSLETAPVVAQVERMGIIEAVHHGLGVITAPDGTVEFAVGDPDTLILPRSCAKPMQAVASLRAGTPARDELLALACSSHSGEAFHRDAVARLLAMTDLTPYALQNTPLLPWNAEEHDRWIREGRGPESIAADCSGKHAGWLTACAVSDWNLADYLDPEHPMQKLVAECLAEIGGAPLGALAVDGCGAPLYQMPLSALARSFGRIAGASEGEFKLIADAMRAHPEYVGGTGRDNTILMRDVPGLIAKDGADSVFAMGLADGRGIALKIVDGGVRARGPFAAALLRRAGVTDEDALARLASSPVLGHGRVVGHVKAVDLA